MNASEQALDNAAKLLSTADHLLIGAGAGIGVDSGLPDFRGTEGFWQAYPAYKRLGRSFVNMANPRSFVDDPAFGWGFYGHRLDLYRKTVPHDGFEILKQWAERIGSHFVFTSNVDGQFQRAAFDLDRVFEVHGSIHHLQCTRPCTDEVWSAGDVELDIDLETMRARRPLPWCINCKQLARPNILMFGDAGYVASRAEEQAHRYDRWRAQLSGNIVAVELGAGSAVPTVRLELERRVAQKSGHLIRINPREPDVPRGQIGFAAGALATLQAIDARL